MPTRVKTIKLVDLLKAVDRAVAESAGTAKIKGGLIIGRQLSAAAAAQVNTKALAREITKDVAAGISGVRLTPKVVKGAGGTTVGFIARSARK